MYLDPDLGIPDDDELHGPHFGDTDSEYAAPEEWDDFDDSDE